MTLVRSNGPSTTTIGLFEVDPRLAQPDDRVVLLGLRVHAVARLLLLIDRAAVQPDQPLLEIAHREADRASPSGPTGGRARRRPNAGPRSALAGSCRPQRTPDAGGKPSSHHSGNSCRAFLAPTRTSSMPGLSKSRSRSLSASSVSCRAAPHLASIRGLILFSPTMRCSSAAERAVVAAGEAEAVRVAALDLDPEHFRARLAVLVPPGAERAAGDHPARPLVLVGVRDADVLQELDDLVGLHLRRQRRRPYETRHGGSVPPAPPPRPTPGWLRRARRRSRSSVAAVALDVLVVSGCAGSARRATSPTPPGS